LTGHDAQYDLLLRDDLSLSIGLNVSGHGVRFEAHTPNFGKLYFDKLTSADRLLASKVVTAALDESAPIKGA